MNKEQAKKQIEELKAKVKELEDNINSKDNPLAYRRKTGDERYYYINSRGKVISCFDDNDPNIDRDHFNNGAYKQTREQAERHAEHTRTLNRLLCIADELNEGWVPNWNDRYQRKFYVYYDHVRSRFSIASFGSYSENKTYFKTEEIAEAALKRLSERDKKVLRGEV